MRGHEIGAPVPLLAHCPNLRPARCGAHRRGARLLGRARVAARRDPASARKSSAPQRERVRVASKVRGYRAAAQRRREVRCATNGPGGAGPCARSPRSRAVSSDGKGDMLSAAGATAIPTWRAVRSGGALVGTHGAMRSAAGAQHAGAVRPGPCAQHSCCARRTMAQLPRGQTERPASASAVTSNRVPSRRSIARQCLAPPPTGVNLVS